MSGQSITINGRGWCQSALVVALFAVAALGLLPAVDARADMTLDAALATTPYPAPPATPATVLIRNGRIWTMDAAGILDGTDVLLKDGRIAAIGKNLRAPAGAMVIDATGRDVTPGIIDAHSHSATEQLDLNEGVNSISSEVRIRDVLDPRAEQIYQQLAGGVTVAHVLHGSGNPIGGQSAIVKYRWGVKNPDDLLFQGAPPTIKFALGENPTHAAFKGGMPGGDSRYPATRMGVAAFMRANFELARQYEADWKRYNALSKREQARTPPPRRDLRLEPLVEILNGKRAVHPHSYRADEILMLMKLGDELGFRIDTFQHALEGYRVANELAAHGAGASTFSDWWSYKMEAYEAIPWNAAIMDERGVLVSLNSDSANLARRLNLEAAKMLHYGGLAPERALAMVTINPARQLHVDQRVGSLAVGKDADVVVWSGDPLSVYTRADVTLVDGKVRFDRERDATHRAEVAAARAELAKEIRGTKAVEPLPASTGVNPPPTNVDYQWARDIPVTPVAIVGATVHTLEGPVIDRGVVVFANGRITAVGGPDTTIPADAERIDATGKHLWPSLIHLGTVLGLHEIDSVAGSVDDTETGDINADADTAVAINAASTHIPVARSGGISHALVVPAGGLVSGTTTFIRTEGWTWEEMTALRKNALAVRWPQPPPPQYQVFLGPPKSPAERRKQTDDLVKQLDQLLDDAEAYDRARKGAGTASRVRFDPQLDALVPVVRGERPLWATAREKYSIEAVVNWAVKRGIRVVISDGRDAYLAADLLASHHVPVVLTDISKEPSRTDVPYDVQYAMPARLEKAGVLFAIASPSRTGGSANARHMRDFAGIAAAYGLDREAAYRAITLNPAKILGLDSILGSIKPGKSASLVLTNGDLLEESTAVEQVWIDGTKPSMDDVQKAAWRKWSNRPKETAAN